MGIDTLLFALAAVFVGFGIGRAFEKRKSHKKVEAALAESLQGGGSTINKK